MFKYFRAGLFFFIIFSTTFSSAKESKGYFPFLAEEALNRGYVLPKPIGINFIYVDMTQDVKVESLKLKGDIILSPFLKPISLEKIITVTAKDTVSSIQNKIVKTDIWLFPFLNIYGLLGETKGYSKTKIDISLNKPVITNADFKLDYDGITYGVGTTIVGGVGNIFVATDVNYTRTSLNIIDGNIDALIISPKLGYNFNFSSFKNSIWIGGMYQEISQTLKGNIADVINMPIPIRNGKFEIKEKAASPWNTVVGFRSEINTNYEIMTEIGFGTKESIALALGYRF